jgi:carboxypeptidase C (cathepsin A)
MSFRTIKFVSFVLALVSPSLATGTAPNFRRRQVPANATDVTTIQSPTGVQIRYKEPGKAGVCETTPGVGSYAGYVDLSPTSHTFFWFFEARHNPETAPLTLWLNGGPGSDSLIGLFQGMQTRRSGIEDHKADIRRTRTLQCD